MTEKHADYNVEGRDDRVRPSTLLLYGEPGYEEPTTSDIRGALERAQLSGSQAGELLGVNGRTIRKWTGGEQAIPYSAWRLLLIYARIVKPSATLWERSRMEAARGNVHEPHVYGWRSSELDRDD